MNTFSTFNYSEQNIKEFVNKNIGGEICDVEELDSWNSGVFKATAADGRRVLVKEYKQDIKNRAEVEFTALNFLHDNGIEQIPCPLFADIDKRLCAYEYIEGRKLTTDEINPPEIASAVYILVKIASLSSKVKYKDLPEASESCFSVKRYVENIDWRIKRLKKEASIIDRTKFKHFLENEISFFREEVLKYIRKGITEYGLNYEGEIPREKRFLSPSDVGFHNILLDKNGGLYFIDFEYFGWDDPAKTVCDFLLEPAVPFPDKYRRCFIKSFKGGINTDINFKRRLTLIYPLLGLKWSLIMLNDFLPGFLRKEQKSSEQFNVHLKNQLEKSKIKLEKTAGEYREFAKMAEEIL